MNAVERIVRATALAGLAVVVALGGCGGGGDGSTVPRELGGSGVRQATSARYGDARFTILIAQYNSPDRVQLAQELISRAKAVLGSQDIWLENADGGIAVNYGHFEKGDEAEREIERVRRLYSRLEAGPYQFPYVKELPEPDPAAPAEWNLLMQGCTFSLEVASYYNVPESGFTGRKASAVEAVGNLRKQGEQAYFVHGRRQSRVYVGCFGPGAVQQGPGGEVQFSPLMMALRQKYPYHENGQVVYQVVPLVEGGVERIKQQAMVMPVDQLRQEVPY